MRANLEDNQARRTRQQSTLYGTVRQTLTGTYVIKDDGPTFHFLDPGGSDRTVQLPVFKSAGGQQYWLINLSSTNQLNVVDSLGAAVDTVPLNAAKVVVSSAREWRTLGALGPVGPAGPPGTPGATYSTTSTTSLATVNSGSVSFLGVTAGLAWIAGARMRATSVGTGEFMEGVVTAYSGTTLTATMDLRSGTGTHADWNINIAGQQGTPGAGSITGGTIHGVAIAGSSTSITGSVVLGNAEILVGQTAADPLNKAVGGDLTMTNLGAFTVAALAITTGKIADLAVTTAKIADAAVTYAKIQNVSATSRVLGRITAGAGATEELTGTNLTTILGGNIAILQPASTLDSVFYWSHTGVATAVALGVAGTALVSTGAAVAPTMQAVLQPGVTSTLTVGYVDTSNSIGTVTGANQTTTPNPAVGNFQHLTLNGSSLTGNWTFAPPSSGSCTVVVEVTNGGSGAVGAALVTSGFTKVSGDTWTTANGSKFLFFCTKTQTYSHLFIQALQ